MHIFTSSDGRADTEPDQLYEYVEVVADDPEAGVSDIGTLTDLIEDYPLLGWMRGDSSLLYEPVIMSLTIGLTHISLKPLGWK